MNLKLFLIIQATPEVKLGVSGLKMGKNKIPAQTRSPAAATLAFLCVTYVTVSAVRGRVYKIVQHTLAIYVTVVT